MPFDANSRPSLVILRVADSDRLLILLDKVLMVNYFERKYINQILFCTKKDIVFLINLSDKRIFEKKYSRVGKKESNNNFTGSECGADVG